MLGNHLKTENTRFLLFQKSANEVSSFFVQKRGLSLAKMKSKYSTTKATSSRFSKGIFH